MVAVRSIIGFFTLLIFARILGRQQISQLTFFEYVLGITIGSIAASLSVDLSSRAWPHWIGLFTWSIIVFIFQFITLKWRSIANYLVGEPIVVIMNGQIMEEAMRKIRYTMSDVLEQLRDKGVFDLNQVQFAVIETNGKVSILLKPQFLPVTPGDLKITTQGIGISNEIIYDGVIIEENLKNAQVSLNWLENELQKRGIRQVSDVFLATIDSSGNIYFDLYKDHTNY